MHSAYGALTLSGRTFQSVLLCIVLAKTLRVIPVRPYNPSKTGLGSSPFARRYLGNLC